LAFYEVVRVKDNAVTRGLGVADATGVIVGIAEEGGHISYAVKIGAEAYSLDHDDVVSTGETLSRADIYSGESIRVDIHGNVLGPGGTESPASEG
jgi:Immunity protein 31